MNSNKIMFFKCLFTANLHLQQKLLNVTLEEILFWFFFKRDIWIDP